jgi:hypothetical protein
MRHFYDAGEGRMLTVEYDYEPEDRALRINGIQMEPDYPATMDILAVLVEGVDIIDLLSDTTLADIEKQIWNGSK